jgi:multidrug resistance efflux pump
MLLKSRIDGRVSGLNIVKGNAVQTGKVICRVTSAGDEEEVVLFVPVAEGKKIKKGMEAVIYLSTVNRQEYGHMDGVVTKVSDSVVSADEMLNQLGDQALVQAYQQSGPVIKVSCSLGKDESTKSG